MNFNKTLEHTKFPDSLEQIIFDLRGFYDVSLDNVKFPENLKVLILSSMFSQPIDKVVFPSKIEKIIFQHNFNQPVEDIKWPDTIKVLHFGWWYKQKIENLPRFLEELLVVHLEVPLTNLPITLKKLYIEYTNDEIVDQCKIPFDCKLYREYPEDEVYEYDYAEDEICYEQKG